MIKLSISVRKNRDGQRPFSIEQMIKIRMAAEDAYYMISQLWNDMKIIWNQSGRPTTRHRRRKEAWRGHPFFKKWFGNDDLTSLSLRRTKNRIKRIKKKFKDLELTIIQHESGRLNYLCDGDNVAYSSGGTPIKLCLSFFRQTRNFRATNIIHELCHSRGMVHRRRALDPLSAETLADDHPTLARKNPDNYSFICDEYYDEPKSEFITTALDNSISSATLELINYHRNWDDNWSQIIPGNFGNSNYTDLLFYNKTTGRGYFTISNGNGDVSGIKDYNWSPGWDFIIPGHYGITSYTDLLFYNRTSGRGLFMVITDSQGNISTINQNVPLGKNWDMIIPGNFGSNETTDLLCYNKSTGRGLFLATRGNVSTIKEHTNWDTNWDIIVPGNFGGSGFTDLLFYKSDGRGLFVTTDGNGNISTLKNHNNWDTVWDSIIPGNFSSSAFTDLLFNRNSRLQADGTISLDGRALFAKCDGNGNLDYIEDAYLGEVRELLIPGDFGDSNYTDLLLYG